VPTAQPIVMAMAPMVRRYRRLMPLRLLVTSG
jgi:hypothetical protein